MANSRHLLPLIVTIISITSVAASPVSTPTCAACQLANGWQSVLGLKSANACPATCQQYEQCEASAILRMMPNSGMQDGKASTIILAQLLKKIEVACQQNPHLLSNIMKPQNSTSDLTCLECFLFKDLLNFINQNFFGGWLEDVILKFVQALGPSISSDATTLVEILFQALRQTENSIWDLFAVQVLNCPSFQDLASVCCTQAHCP